jgi:hypothetical protein
MMSRMAARLMLLSILLGIIIMTTHATGANAGD